MGLKSRRRTSFLAAALLLVSGPARVQAGQTPDQLPPLPVSGLSGVTFLTADFAPLQKFYGQGAGLARLQLAPDLLRFEVGASQWIDFRKVPRPDWTRRLQFVTLEAPDLERVARELRERGVAITWVGHDQGRRTLQFVDPAGDVIRVAEPWKYEAPALPGAVPFSDHLQHFGFAVPSEVAAATKAFYGQRLGFAEAVSLKEKGGKTALVKFRIPGPKGDMIELIFFEPPLNKWAAGAFDHVDFEVNDINSAYRQLHKGGIATQSRHLPTVNGEHLWAIDIIDPELTRMEIQERTPATAPIGSISNVGGESARPLFDGRTLEGWEGNLANWRVEDGAIVAGELDRRQPHNEFLMAAGDFGNFELRLQYKIEGSGGFVNGGVQFWSQRVPNSYEVSGFQADLGAGTDGNLYDESRRNSNLATASADVRLLALKPGAWNDYRIRAVGPHIEIWLNGMKTVDYTEPDKRIPLHGRFALQIHGYANTKVSYRGLEVEVMPGGSQAP